MQVAKPGPLRAKLGLKQPEARTFGPLLPMKKKEEKRVNEPYLSRIIRILEAKKKNNQQLLDKLGMKKLLFLFFETRLALL